MQEFEKPGSFYLGRGYDISAASPKPNLVLYDAEDLTTHAVCVGMTGSGKTGLCLALLEEAAIDSIPGIAIDPKGDLPRAAETGAGVGGSCRFLPEERHGLHPRGMGIGSTGRLVSHPIFRRKISGVGMTIQLVAAICLSIATVSSTKAGDHWTSYRGPSDQGLCDSADLPAVWSERENIVWKREIPGKAWSSPVIWGDRVWLTNATDDGTQLSVLCVDKQTGRITLNKRLRYVPAPQYCHPFNSYASPSPAIEEGRIYVSFGSPYNACLDSQTGEVIWERTDFVCNHFRGAGSSPFIYNGLLVLHFDGSDQQYVVALDKQTGQTVWKTDRSVDYQDIDPETGGPKMEGDLRKAFSTPVIAHAGGKPVLVSLGSMALYGYDPETGKELWRAESIGSHSGSCRPVVGDGLIFSAMGYTAEIWAVRPDGRGLVNDSQVVWKYPRSAARRSSFLLVDGRLFTVDAAGVAACLDAKTGDEIWRTRIGGNHSASPIYCRGRIYFFDESGTATVIEAASRYKVIAVNRLDDGCMASPAVSGNALYVRTKAALYRIEGNGSGEKRS